MRGLVMAIALVVAAGCGDDDGGAGADAAGAGDGAVSDPDAGAAAAPLRGHIEVVEVSDPYGSRGHAHGGVLATASSHLRFTFYGNISAVHFQKEVDRVGDCRLLRPEAQFCNDCAGLCVGPDICEPLPEQVDVGTLTFAGLRSPLTLDFNGYWYASQASVPADAFADDASVTLSAPGAAGPAFQVTTTAVAPLNMMALTDHELAAGNTDTVVTWTPADPGSRVRLTLNANNMGHGLAYAAIIECDADDSAGQITIPGSLLSQFPNTFRWEACAGSDCPLSSMRRYRLARATVGSDEIWFVVASERQFWVIH